MKIQIITPLRMQWLEGYRRLWGDHVLTVTEHPRDIHGRIPPADLRIFMWLNEETVNFIHTQPREGRRIVFVRRYEYYTTAPEMCNWKNVDAVIMVNDFLAAGFEKRTGVRPHVVYNGVDPSRWTYRERGHGKKVAWVGFLNQKKNLPLALQIMAALPKDIELHVAGEVQDGASVDYLVHVAEALRVRVFLYGPIPHEHMDGWMEDKNYILSTALSEGCPNHVIEAMAKGIKPIVHNWPGAREQFGDLVFNAVNEAVSRMDSSSPYDSEGYRKLTEEKFGWPNYLRVKEIAEGLYAS